MLAMGWWKDVGFEGTIIKIVLISTELSEAVEGIINGLQDDKLRHYPMEHVEMVDAILRITDLLGRYRFFETDTARGLKPLRYHPGFIIVSKLASITIIHCSISKAIEAFRKGDLKGFEYSIWKTLYRVLDYCEKCKIPIEQIIEEKMEFNRHREDHKLENRAKEGGKKV
jgi:hypothetical protein